MTKWTLLGVAGLIATTVAVACNPATTLSGKSDSIISHRSADTTFYDRAKAGAKNHVDSVLNDSTLKLKVTNLDVVYAPAKGLKIQAEGDDTAGELDGVATMDVTVGSGTSHKVEIDEVDFPPMSNRDNSFTLIDQTERAAFSSKQANGPSSLKVSTDQDVVRATITDGAETLTLTLNPDGTYAIDGQPAMNVSEAAAAIASRSLCKKTSLAALGGLYGCLIRREKLIETLSPTPCANGGATRVGKSAPDGASLVKAIIELKEKDAGI